MTTDTTNWNRNGSTLLLVSSVEKYRPRLMTLTLIKLVLTTRSFLQFNMQHCRQQHCMGYSRYFQKGGGRGYVIIKCSGADILLKELKFGQK